MKASLTLLAILLAFFVHGQELKKLHPVGYTTFDFSAEGEKAFQENKKKCEEIWAKTSNGVKYQDLPEEDKEILKNCDEVEVGYWGTDNGMGCSWYCGGGPKKVTASSFLKSQGENTYEAENAHDLNYKNAWVEGVSGYGIGEFLEYHFAAQSPRINLIKVANGYVKSEAAWKNNSRVKKLKMYVDDQPYAILNLLDIRGEQRFEVPPIGRPRDEKGNIAETEDWTIKFEILEIYKGDKYEDVVISEIFFDGLDVHCLAKGTEVLMADSTTVKIENLQLNDQVLSFNPELKIYEGATVLEIAQPWHDQLIEIEFTNGNTIRCTYDHPFLSADQQWLSYDPLKTQRDYQYDQVLSLKEGTELYSPENKKLIIKTITEINEAVQTYTIVKLDKNNAFIVNGVISGTGELRARQACSVHK
jgi:hypothetical protein